MSCRTFGRRGELKHFGRRSVLKEFVPEDILIARSLFLGRRFKGKEFLGNFDVFSTRNKSRISEEAYSKRNLSE
jgi:hypothetical protein